MYKEDIANIIATIAIWGGVAGLSYLFHYLGILNQEGAAWMVGGAFVLTLSVWGRGRE